MTSDSPISVMTTKRISMAPESYLPTPTHQKECDGRKPFNMDLNRNLALALGMIAFGIGAAPQAKADCEIPAPLATCKMCHQLTHGQPAKPTGPNISAVYGSKAMVSPDFSYSPAVKMAAEKGLVWTPENLNAYLLDQHGFLAKFNGEALPNKMILMTLKDDAKRAKVVEALKEYKDCK